MAATADGLSVSPKITARQLHRRAYVYVRQSSPQQVRHHREGRENQYALRDRAIELGWTEGMVRVIDSDLGLSGKSADGRNGFKELVGEVSLGHAGLVLCYEASRLARNNADWYSLLDLCALRGTLIADADGVYDPSQYNDRLLLGLRGMMSEAELYLLRGRMDAGRMRQVRRGTYRQALPTGLSRLPGDRVLKDPDVHIQKTISLVFERFEALGSAQKVMRSLRDDEVLLPRRQVAGERAGQLLWRRPTSSAIHEILRNPAYAGAFVYGRQGADPDRPPGSTATIRKPMEEWIAVHKGAYPAYISWEKFLAIQGRLDQNGYCFAQNRPGAPKGGRALLAGLVFCGRCGRRMQVHYRDPDRGPRYICRASANSHGGPTCSHLQGAAVDEAVVEAFFEAVRPSEIALLEEVLEAGKADRENLMRHHREAVRGAEYEARLAEKRYRQVDPENRLVASELEKGWESALQTLAGARDVAERFEREQCPQGPALEPALREQLSDLGAGLPGLWRSGHLRQEHKKELLRSLIQRVILSRPSPEALEVKIVWISGAVSPLTVAQRIMREADLVDHGIMVGRALELVEEGHTDAAVGRILSEEGFRSARNPDGVTGRRVSRIRAKHGVPSPTNRFRGEEKYDGKWTVLGLSRELGVERNWVYRRIRSGDLPAERSPDTGYYLVEDEPGLIAEFREQTGAKHRT